MAAPATTPNRLAAPAPLLLTMEVATTLALLAVAGEGQGRILRTLPGVAEVAGVLPVRVVRRVPLPHRVRAVGAGDARSRCGFPAGPLQHCRMETVKKTNRW